MAPRDGVVGAIACRAAPRGGAKGAVPLHYLLRRCFWSHPPDTFPMRNLLCLLAALALVAGCEKNPTEPLPGETSFTFEYRLGADAWQTFSVTGQQPDGTPLGTRGNWVFTAGTVPTVITYPQQPSGSGGWITFLAYLPTVATIDSVFLGSEAAMTCPGPNSPCMQTWFRIENAAGATLEQCVIADGMMHITRRTAQWLSGDFSGTGTCSGGGATRAFQVRNGEFDVGLPAPESAPG